MTKAFEKNTLMLGHVEGHGFVFEGDTYCIKHQELLHEGFHGTHSCEYCEWGD